MQVMLDELDEDLQECLAIFLGMFFARRSSTTLEYRRGCLRPRRTLLMAMFLLHIAFGTSAIYEGWWIASSFPWDVDPSKGEAIREDAGRIERGYSVSIWHVFVLRQIACGRLWSYWTLEGSIQCGPGASTGLHAGCRPAGATSYTTI
jgi:hypothetical protein